MKDLKVTGKGKFRKNKAYGLVCGVALSVAFLGGQVVSAEETTQPNTEVVSNESTETTQKQVDTQVDTSITQEQAKEKIESEQNTVKDNVVVAEDKGVIVEVSEEVTDVVLNEDNKAEKTKEVLEDLAKQNEELIKATEKQVENQNAYDDAVNERGDAVSKGQSDLVHSKAKLDEQVAIAKRNELEVKTTTNTLKPNYIDITGLEGQELTQAMAKNIELYNQAVKSGVATQDKSTAEMKAKIDEYLQKLSDYQKGLGGTGIKWTSNTTVEALENVTKMRGDENVTDFRDGSIKRAAMVATQGARYTENTDANFDNIFRIDDWSKGGAVMVKNTSNGDVKLVFNGYQGLGFTGQYFAIWGADDGGIAWSVFGTNTARAGGSTGEGGSGGGSIGTGRYLAVITGYSLYAETANNVSVATINDVDNRQTVRINALDLFDGATVEVGKNITRNDNVLTVGAGDVSEGSSGELGSNGMRWKFEEPRKVVLHFTHDTSLRTATSIVAGIFGSASDIPVEPEKPVVQAEYVNVELPQEPTQPKPQQVAVKYYNVTTTPKPEVPTPTTPTPETPMLPKTGEQQASVSMLGLGLLALSPVAYIGLKREDEKE